MTPELLNKISQWRQRCIDGTITQNEWKEAIKALREDRRNAIAQGKTASSRKAAGPVRSADDILKGLDAI